MTTPHRTLAVDNGLPNTPSGRMSIHHTPLNRSVRGELVHTIRRGHVSSTTGAAIGGRGPLTPHARVALHGRAQRRAAALTPGRRRRRSSIRERRDSPLGALKSLGRLLATNSRPIDSSPSSPESQPRPRGPSLGTRDTTLRFTYDDGGDDDDDLLLSNRPRLSLPIDAYDDDDDDLHPHQSTGLEEENYTAHSIEMPRRALIGAHQRESFGSVRLSGFNYPNRTHLGPYESFFDGALELGSSIDEGAEIGGSQAGSPYTRIEGVASRRETLDATRESDFGLHVPLDLPGDETTFVLGFEGHDHDRSTLDQPQGDSPSNDIGSIDFDHHFESGDDKRSGISTFVGNENDNDNEDGSDIGIDYGRDDKHVSPSSGVTDHGHGLSYDWSDGFDYNAGDDENSSPRDTQNARASDMGDNTVNTRVIGDNLPFIMGSKNSNPLDRISRYGARYHVLPPMFVKKAVRTCMRTYGAGNMKLTPDTVAALTDVSDWFLQQVGADLDAYATHARRKFIDESDIYLLMKRQAIVGTHKTLFSLGQRYLPKELLQQVRMLPQAGPSK